MSNYLKKLEELKKMISGGSGNSTGSPSTEKETSGSAMSVLERIKAKIGYNISKGTREENIYIIKNIIG